MIYDSTAQLLLDNRDFKFKIMDYTSVQKPVSVLVAVKDLDFAKSLGYWNEVTSEDMIDYLDFSDNRQADLFLYDMIEKGEFEPLEFLNQIAFSHMFDKYKDDTYKYFSGNLVNEPETIDAVARYIRKLIDLGYVCQELMKQMAGDSDYTEYYG